MSTHMLKSDAAPPLHSPARKLRSLGTLSHNAQRQVEQAIHSKHPPALNPQITNPPRPPGLFSAPQPDAHLPRAAAADTSAPPPSPFERSPAVPKPNHPGGPVPTYTAGSSAQPWPQPSTLKLRPPKLTTPAKKSMHLEYDASNDDDTSPQKYQAKTGPGPLKLSVPIAISDHDKTPPMSQIGFDDFWLCKPQSDDEESRAEIIWPTSPRPTRGELVPSPNEVRAVCVSIGLGFRLDEIREVHYFEKATLEDGHCAPFVFIYGTPHDPPNNFPTAIAKNGWWCFRVRPISDGCYPMIGSTVESWFPPDKVQNAKAFKLAKLEMKIGDLRRAMPTPEKERKPRGAAPQRAIPKKTGAKPAAKRVAAAKPVEQITLDDDSDAQPDEGNKKPVPVQRKIKTDSSDEDYNEGDSLGLAPPRVAQTILVYPHNQPDAVTIVDEDLTRLQPNECLNDSVIDFWLRYWYNEMLTEDERKRCYVFNTFFFNTLNTPQGAHKVIRWTNKIDIFQYDFLIMPVNQQFHWRLAVVCFPKYVKLPRTKNASKAVKMFLPTILVLDSMGLGMHGIPAPTRMFLELEADKDSRKDYEWPTSPPKTAEADTEEQPVKSDTTNTSTEDAVQCSVVIEPGSEVEPPEPTKKGKKGTPKADAAEPTTLFNAKSLPAVAPTKLPKQDNYTDCGVYLLCYAESFVAKPPETPCDKASIDAHFKEFMKHITPEKINEKRRQIRDTIFRLANKTPEQIEEIERSVGIRPALISPDAPRADGDAPTAAGPQEISLNTSDDNIRQTRSRKAKKSNNEEENIDIVDDDAPAQKPSDADNAASKQAPSKPGLIQVARKIRAAAAPAPISAQPPPDTSVEGVILIPSIQGQATSNAEPGDGISIDVTTPTPTSGESAPVDIMNLTSDEKAPELQTTTAVVTPQSDHAEKHTAAASNQPTKSSNSRKRPRADDEVPVSVASSANDVPRPEEPSEDQSISSRMTRSKRRKVEGDSTADAPGAESPRSKEPSSISDDGNQPKRRGKRSRTHDNEGDAAVPVSSLTPPRAAPEPIDLSGEEEQPVKLPPPKRRKQRDADTVEEAYAHNGRHPLRGEAHTRLPERGAKTQAALDIQRVFELTAPQKSPKAPAKKAASPKTLNKKKPATRSAKQTKLNFSIDL